MVICKFLSRSTWHLLDVAELLDLNGSLGHIVGGAIRGLPDLMVGFEFHLLKVVLVDKVIKRSKP